VEIHIKPVFAKTAEEHLEQGFDEKKGMRFIKVFYNRNLA
jgi:hypothetical protein